MKKFLSALLAGAMLTVGASMTLAAEPSPTADGIVLKDGAFLKIDDEAGRLTLIDGPITVAKLQKQITSSVTVTGNDGKTKSDDAPVATGDKITAGGTSLTALLFGDVNCDGRIDLSDAVLTLRYAAGQNVDIDTAAADVEPDKKIDTADAVKLLRYVAGWAVSPGDVRMVAANKTETAPNEDATIDLFFETPMERYERFTTESTGKYTYTMKMAKGESEATQIILVSETNREGISVEVSDFEYEFGGNTDKIAIDLRDTHYYPFGTMTQGLDWSHVTYEGRYNIEPLPPMSDSIELTAGTSKIVMLDVTAAADAPAGMYRASVNVKNADGQVIKTAYVYAYVWNFALPETPYSASAFGLGTYKPNQYKSYYDDLLSYRISAYKIPYNISSPQADEYLNNPAVTAFCIHGEGYGGANSESESEIRASIRKLHTNPDWEDRAYYYTNDEPWKGETFDKIESDWYWIENMYKEELGESEPYNIYTCVPLSSNGIVDAITGVDRIARMTGFVTLWCPQSLAFTAQTELSPNNYRFSTVRSFQQYGPDPDRFYKMRTEDENKLWWYICNSPQWPYANYYTTYAGFRTRMVAWQQFLFDIDGILFWTVSEWDSTSKYQTRDIGVLIYWAELFGFSEGGLVPSYRLLNVRDSFDDFDYLRMAEELCGRDAVIDVVREYVTTRMMDYSEDYHDMETAREIIAQMILDNMD